MIRSKRITLLVAGAALLAAGIWVSEAGMRTLAHTVGYAGMVMLIYCGLLATGKAQSNREQVVTQIVGAGSFVGLLIVSARLGVLRADVAALFTLLAVYALAAGLIISAIKYVAGPWLRERRKSFNQIRPRYWAVYAALGVAVMMSLGWELVYQPYIAVYDKGPRGTVQYWHVAADLVGIAVGLALSLCVAKPAGQSGKTRSAMPI